MRIAISCAIGRHPISVDATIRSSGAADFCLPVFCPECRQSFDAKQLMAMEDETEFNVHEYERSWMMLDGLDDDDYKECA